MNGRHLNLYNTAPLLGIADFNVATHIALKLEDVVEKGE
jgi:hypothetical protein